ncbi:MAG: 50S ribosomal protein L22 [Candidatus Stahlbacteria bacterium]|nr:MAG: 50S ribosomal protein L22 [Candidatus Stahlbacteria bacterium]
MKMIGKAIQKNVHLSPKKGRRIIPEVKGKSVKEAEMILDFYPNKVAMIMKKCIHAAASNYIDRAGDIELKEDDLYVKSVRIDAGQRLKRYRAMSLGRAGIIRKQRAHITVIVDKIER